MPDVSGQLSASSRPLRPQGAWGDGDPEGDPGSAPRPDASGLPGLRILTALTGLGCGVSSRAANSMHLPGRGPWGPAPLQSNGLASRGPDPVAGHGAASGSGESRALCPRRCTPGSETKVCAAAQAYRRAWAPQQGWGPPEGLSSFDPPEIPSAGDLNQPFSKHTKLSSCYPYTVGTQ